MRHSWVCVFVYLFVRVQFGTGANAIEPGECCFNYYARRIHIRKIESYKVTREGCVKPGVILITKKGLQICVDPQQSWVSRTLQMIDDRNFY